MLSGSASEPLFLLNSHTSLLTPFVTCSYNIFLYLPYTSASLSFIRYLRCSHRVNPSLVLLVNLVDNLHPSPHVNRSCVHQDNLHENQHNNQQVNNIDKPIICLANFCSGIHLFRSKYDTVIPSESMPSIHHLCLALLLWFVL